MKRSTNCMFAGRIIFACVLGCLILLIQTRSAAAATPVAAGIWCSDEDDHRLGDLNKKQLESSLRRITGFQGLRFGEDNSLSLGDLNSPSGGSSSARQILFCLLSSGKSFIIEDHSGSESINFGQMDEGTQYEDQSIQLKIEIWRVRLDFEDFREMAAGREVRKSFDAGFTMLHELLHGIGFKDAEHEDEIGECEELINRARVDLGLPVREQYFGDPVQLAPNAISVRLRFRAESKASKANSDGRTQYLFFILPVGYKIPPAEEAISVRGVGSKKGVR